MDKASVKNLSNIVFNKNEIIKELKRVQESSNLVLAEKSDKALEDVVSKAMVKVKEYFFKNMVDDEKLAQFIYKILTLDDGYKDGKLTSESAKLDEIITQMLHKSSDVNISKFIDKILGEETAKTVFDRLTTEKVDAIVGKVLGEDTKRLITEKLETDDLDALLNKLVDEKLSMEDGVDGSHPTFDEFIDKILGKEVEEFLRKKLKTLIANSKKLNTAI